MAGQAGVWMLLVLLPCLCISTVRAGFPPFQDPELVIASAQFQRQCSCSQALSQGRATLAGQSEVLKRLSGLSLAFQNLRPSLQSIENKMTHIIANQRSAQQNFQRFQGRMEANISDFRESQNSLRRALARFQSFAESEFQTLKQSERKILSQLERGDNAIIHLVKNENDATRALLAKSQLSIQSELGEMKKLVKALLVSLAASGQESRPIGQQRQLKVSRGQSVSFH